MPKTQISQTFFEPNVEGLGSAPFIRFWYTGQNFIAGDGVTPVTVGDGQNGFYIDHVCSISSSRLLMPAIDLWATTDGSPATSRFFGQLYTEQGSPTSYMLFGEASGWQLPTVYGSPITYDELAQYNAAAYLLAPPSTYFTTDQTIAEILRLAATQNYAGFNILGRTELSVAPISASDPIAVGNNDPRTIDISNYASFAAMISAIGPTPTTFNIHGNINVTANATVPSTLTLRFLNGGSLTLTTGVTLTIQGPIVADLVKIFYNATAGQGTVSFTGNTKLTEDSPEWWGAVGDGATNDAAAIQAAINAWPSATGGTVIFSAPYGVGASGINITSKNYIVLKSSGAQKAGFKQLADSIQVGALVLADLFLTGCTGCRVEGLYIDGNSMNGDPISLVNCTDCWIEGNNCFSGSSASAGAMISSTDGLRNVYRANKAHDAVGASRGMWIGNTNSDGEDQAIIDSNTVWNTGSGIIGVFIDCVISNNTVGPNNGGGSGIGLAATTGADNVSKRTLVIGNTITGAGFAGIQSDASPPSYTEFITVVGNSIYNCGNGGIYVVNARDWVVSGNNLVDNLSIGGIFLQTTLRATITGNQISNTASGASRPAGNGISLSVNSSVVGVNISDITITGNTIRNMKNAGVRVDSGATAITSNVTISGNAIDACDGYGIALSGLDATLFGINVVGNTVINNSIDGTSQNLVAAQIQDVAVGDGIVNVADNVVTSGRHWGTAVLVGGTATVATNAAKFSRIILTRIAASGTRGELTVGTITSDTSFVIRSEDSAGSLVADTSTVYWKIVN